MVSDRGASELVRGSSWRSVRGGLRLLFAIWLLLTIAGVIVGLGGLRLAPAAEAGDAAAAAWLAISGFLFQVLYVACAAGLAVSAVRITRAPPATRAIPPALVSAASFVTVTLLALVVLAGGKAATAATELWVLLAIGRAIGVMGLLLVLIRLLAAGTSPVRPPLAVAAFALALVDTLAPLYRLLSEHASESTNRRAILLVVQVVLAFVILHFTRRAQREAAQNALEEKPPPPPEAETSRPARAPQRAREESAEPVVQSELERVVTALLVAIAVGALPVWDAQRGVPDTYAALFAIAGLAIAAALYALLSRQPYAARLVFALALVLGAGYAGITSYRMARARSHMIDAWAVCDTGTDTRGNLVDPSAVYRGPYAGERLPNGDPCTRAAERRDRHEEDSPEGDFQDGAVQIAIRFIGDRYRFFAGTLGVFLALGIALRSVVRAARAG